MFCSKCGNDIPIGSRFCAGCGTPVSAFPNIETAVAVSSAVSELPINAFAPKKSKKGVIVFLVILVLLIVALTGALIYLNNDEARIQDCLDKFSVACSNGDYNKAASCCTGSLRTVLKAAAKTHIDYKGIGIKYNDMSKLIMSMSGESIRLTVKDIDIYGDRADVEVKVKSKNNWGSSTDEDTVQLVKVFGLFWKIEQI